jgi:hypothetical protein
MKPVDTNKPTAVGAADAHSFSLDTRDPVARFLRKALKLDWLKLWFVALLIYGPIEKLLIPYIGGCLNLSGSITKWVPHVEALLTGFVEFPFFLAFYLWTGRGIANLFMSLGCNKSFADQERYTSFMQRVEAACDHWWCWVLSAGLAFIAVLLMHFVTWGPNAIVPPWFGERTYERILALVLIGFVAYAVAQIVIREILALFWLQGLWDEMGDNLVIHPYHADGAGGLGAIGQHAVTFFYFVMMLMLFIVMASILPSLLEASPHVDDAKLSLRFWSPLILVIWVLYLILVPFMFFLLIWPSHRAMCKVRDDWLNKVSKQLDEQLGTAEASIVSDRTKLANIMKEVKNLKEIRAIILEDFPTWPISVQTQRLFGFTSALPTAYSLLTVVVDLLR